MSILSDIELFCRTLVKEGGLTLISDYLSQFLQLQYYDFLDCAIDESPLNESPSEKAKREDSLMLRNIFFYMFYILKAASAHGTLVFLLLSVDVLLARIARLDFVPTSLHLINQLVAILNATANSPDDDANSVILCDPQQSNASSLLSPAKTVFAAESNHETPTNPESLPSLPAQTVFVANSSLETPANVASLPSLPFQAVYSRGDSASSLGSATSSVCYMGQSDEGYDVATYISARHRQFLDLSRDMGILVLNRPSDSTLPEDVVTMIYYLLNTVVQFLQQCVHHSEAFSNGMKRRLVPTRVCGGQWVRLAAEAGLADEQRVAAVEHSADARHPELDRVFSWVLALDSRVETLANNVLSSHDVESLLLLLLCTLLDRDTFEAYNQRLEKPVETRELLQQVLTLISEQAASSGGNEGSE